MESRYPFDCPLSSTVCDSGSLLGPYLMQVASLKSPSHPSYGFLAFLSLGLKVDSVFLIYLACPVLPPAVVMVLLAVGSLALHVFSLASNMLTGLILTYKHASGVVNDQLARP